MGSTQNLDDIILQSNEQVAIWTQSLEDISYQLGDSLASAETVSEFRSSLKALVSQANDMLDTLNAMHEMEEPESLFVDPDYRSEYWHSIEQVEFDDEYAPDLDGYFTVDDLLAIGEPTYGIRTLRSISQFHNFPHSDVSKANEYQLVAYLINLPKVSPEHAKRVNNMRQRKRNEVNRAPRIKNTRKVRAEVIRTGAKNFPSSGLNKYEVWLNQAESEIRFDNDSPIIDFDGIDASFLDDSEMTKINGLTLVQRRIYVTKVIEACQYLRNRATREERQNGTIHCVWHIQFWCSFAYWFAKSERMGECLIWMGRRIKTSGSRKDVPAIEFRVRIDRIQDKCVIHPALLSYLLTPNSERIPYKQDMNDVDRWTISHLESNYDCIEADHVVRESWALNKMRDKCLRKCASRCECQPACLHITEQFEIVPCRQHANDGCLQ